MKQGRGHSSKGEGPPKAHGRIVNPGGAGQIGLVQARPRAIENLYGGRGDSKSPTSKVTVHHNGSQGKR